MLAANLSDLTFGQRVRVLRERRFESAAAFARAVGGRSRQWASQIETDKYRPDFETLVEIADVLGVSCDYLLRGTSLAGESPFVAELKAIEADGLLTAPARRRLLQAAYAEADEATVERAHHAELEATIQYIEAELSPAHAQRVRDALATAQAESRNPSDPGIPSAGEAAS